jgi:hypothetical protein
LHITPLQKKSATALCATAAIFSACFMWGCLIGLKIYGYQCFDGLATPFTAAVNQISYTF